MTDRYNALVVILEQDMRDDDAEGLIAAINQLRGVLKVEPNVARGIDQVVAEQRVRTDLTDKLLRVLHPEWKTTN